eukprot:CAMPEP_0182836210 /NCGR_PEP_ID=MMETSP0006_2-20121128/21959_1 /TAXON_ID=97485 /ORGANISM="Prymnesium parvum, Strain Texoma1" /LENGTH=51 /DNA_ID=CAMNT_0024964773 /DNA_START=66 /DNA_END=218 /DNA_ORIENTATION=-
MARMENSGGRTYTGLASPLLVAAARCARHCIDQTLPVRHVARKLAVSWTYF